MNQFQYYTPTKIVFGKDAENQTGNLVKEQGCSKVLLHYGSGSVIRSGLLARIEEALQKEGVAYVSLGGVVPNPRLSLVRKGIALCKKEGVDFILAVGGGSVIDSAKAIGYGCANEGDVWDFYEKKRTASACLPIGAVLTIAAAGSEMSDSSVITNEDGWIKRGYSSNYCRCRFAVLNPELTYTLPDYQTQSGCTDILMHTLERYLNQADNMDMTDGISEALLRTVMKHSLILKEDPYNYKSRAEIMWASSLSHNGLTGCGTDGGDWASHQIEHELGGMFDVAHGAGLAAVWGSWARYVYEARPERFAKLAEHVLGISNEEKPKEEKQIEEKQIEQKKIALAGIEAMEAYFHKIGMPTSLHELGINPSEKEILEMAEKCCFWGKRTVGVVKKLNASDVAKIYRQAR